MYNDKETYVYYDHLSAALISYPRVSGFPVTIKYKGHLKGYRKQFLQIYHIHTVVNAQLKAHHV